VLQIIVLAVAGLIGTMVRQVPSFALRDPGAYARELADLHARYDPISLLGIPIGPGMVDLFDRLGFFRVFSAPWFTFLLTLLVVSIVVCTIDRLPRLWRGVRDVRVVQADAFFDLRLPARARFEGTGLTESDLVRVLRRRRFHVRTAGNEGEEPGRHLLGDRNRYFKMATLFTHLGLITFLAGGAVTGALGYETVVFLGEGQTAPVQAVGTPHNLLVKNHSFEAPRRGDGSFADFWTDVSVYQDGREVARKTIRVNDPLSVAGFVFHQNTFGPSADLEIRDGSGKLVWNGPVLLAGELLGLPQGFITVPGSDLGLLVLLDRDATGAARLALSGLRDAGDGTSQTEFLTALGLGAQTEADETGGYRIKWTRAGAFTGMVVKSDPGQGLIWVAYLSLIGGLLFSFYFPRRRIWARVSEDRIDLAMLSDRYVDTEREFAELLDDLAIRSGQRPLRAPG
jgi:cytochrome c biogenesis protein